MTKEERMAELDAMNKNQLALYAFYLEERLRDKRSLYESVCEGCMCMSCTEDLLCKRGCAYCEQESRTTVCGSYSRRPSTDLYEED